MPLPGVPDGILSCLFGNWESYAWKSNESSDTKTLYYICKIKTLNAKLKWEDCGYDFYVCKIWGFENP